MDKLKDWHNQIVALVALCILVAGFVLAPEERLEKVGHALVAFGSTAAGQTVYAALTALVVAAFRWALARIPSTETRPQRIPPGSGALLLALALGATVSGCDGGSVSVPTIIGVAEVVVTGTCTGATKLCERRDPTCGSGACHVAHDVCPALAPAAPVQVSCDQPVPASP